MNLLTLTIISAAYLITLVESGCSYLNFYRVDFDGLCEKWWKNSDKYVSYSRSRRKCIQMIQEKCPYMLQFETKIYKDYDRYRLYYERWQEEVTATRKDNAKDWKYYSVYKNHPLCWDNRGTSIDCDFWWKIAQENTAENKDKEFCIGQILKYCKNKIEFVDGKINGEVQHWRKRYTIKTVTYKDKLGQKASFNSYVRKTVN